MSAVPALYRPRIGRDPSFDVVLDRRVYAILATTSARGGVHCVPVLYAFDGERFLFETNRATGKARNVEATGRARVLVEMEEHSGWIAASGPARVVTDGAAELNEQVYARYLSAEGVAMWTGTIAPLDDVCIVLTPDRWSTWDLGEMMSTIASHGYDPERAGSWFLPLDA